MKKLLLVLAVAGFVACNNGGTEETKDSVSTQTTTPADSPVVTPPATGDSLHTGDSTNTPKPDSTKK